MSFVKDMATEATDKVVYGVAGAVATGADNAINSAVYGVANATASGANNAINMAGGMYNKTRRRKYKIGMKRRKKTRGIRKYKKHIQKID